MLTSVMSVGRNVLRIGASLVVFAVLTWLLAGCAGSAESTSQESASVPSAVDETTDTVEPQDEAVESEEEAVGMSQTRTVKATFGEYEVLFELLDNPAADDLYDRLPMSVEFSDFNQTEKIGYPPEALTLDGSPDSCDPAVGDLALYAPWGNLSLFYEDFRHSEGLVPLGSAVSGAEHLREIGEGQVVALERA